MKVERAQRNEGQNLIFFHPFLRVSGEDGEKKQNLNPF